MLDEAQKSYAIICDIHGTRNQAIYFCSYAVLLYKKNWCEEAFEKIIQATKINQTMLESWFNFGILYEKCKQNEEAVVAYNWALEIAPDNEEARQWLNAVKQPSYVFDEQSAKMKFPEFWIHNSLIIDRSYKQMTQSIGSFNQIF